MNFDQKKEPGGRIVNDSTAATETYIAHNLPDKTVDAVTPAGLLEEVLEEAMEGSWE